MFCLFLLVNSRIFSFQSSSEEDVVKMFMPKFIRKENRTMIDEEANEIERKEEEEEIGKKKKAGSFVFNKSPL